MSPGVCAGNQETRAYLSSLKSLTVRVQPVAHLEQRVEENEHEPHREHIRKSPQKAEISPSGWLSQDCALVAGRLTGE